MPLDPDDYRLSMKISQKGRVEIPGLRTLLVHRLTAGSKLVLRRPLRPRPRDSEYALFCEPCGAWTREDAAAELTSCPGCGRSYRLEMAVYQEITDDDEPQ